MYDSGGGVKEDDPLSEPVLDRYSTRPFRMVFMSSRFAGEMLFDFTAPSVADLQFFIEVDVAHTLTGFKGGEYRYSRRVSCPVCSGTGGEDGAARTCSLCGGSGMANHLFQVVLVLLPRH